MAYPQLPKRRINPVRILALVIGGIILGVVLCCGVLFLAGTVSPNVYP